MVACPACTRAGPHASARPCVGGRSGPCGLGNTGRHRASKLDALRGVSGRRLPGARAHARPHDSTGTAAGDHTRPASRLDPGLPRVEHPNGPASRCPTYPPPRPPRPPLGNLPSQAFRAAAPLPTQESAKSHAPPVGGGASRSCSGQPGGKRWHPDATPTDVHAGALRKGREHKGERARPVRYGRRNKRQTLLELFVIRVFEKSHGVWATGPSERRAP
jgi:hypothetical protein